MEKGGGVSGSRNRVSVGSQGRKRRGSSAAEIGFAQAGKKGGDQQQLGVCICIQGMERRVESGSRI